MTEEEFQKKADEYPSLGVEYFAARDIAERFMAKYEAEHFKTLADKFCSLLRDQMWDDIVGWFLSDTESNLSGEIRHRIERCIEALLTGNQAYINQFVLPEYSSFGEEIRKAIAVHIPQELQTTRIADLEKENARLKE